MAKLIRQLKLKRHIGNKPKRSLLIEIQYVDIDEALQILHRSICVHLKKKCANQF